MKQEESASLRVWTIAEAKARLSEILRLAENEGPQTIGARKAFIVVPAETWNKSQPQRKPMGKWPVENLPRDIEIELPDRRSSRENPFQDEQDEYQSK